MSEEIANSMYVHLRHNDLHINNILVEYSNRMSDSLNDDIASTDNDSENSENNNESIEDESISYEVPDEKRLLKEHDITTICIICWNLIRDPAVVGGAELCSHYYCYNCLQKARSEDNYIRCPNCRNESTELVKLECINQILKNIRVKCRDARCPIIYDLSQESIHEKKCEFLPQKCQWLECQYQASRKELIKHENECEYKPIICSKCQNQVYQHVMSISKHLKLDCPEAYTKCIHESCGKTFKRKFLMRHLNICPYEQVCCPNIDCKYQGERWNLKLHIRHCPYQLIRCTHRWCEEFIQRRQLRMHQSLCRIHEPDEPMASVTVYIRQHQQFMNLWREIQEDNPERSRYLEQMIHLES